MDYGSLADALDPASCARRATHPALKPVKYKDRNYQAFLDNATVAAPLVTLPQSLDSPVIPDTSSGLIVDEWNAPNSGHRHSVGVVSNLGIPYEYSSISGQNDGTGYEILCDGIKN